ncbi:VOC family protein (plasmid) [Coraliomargarita sp. W4R53]
MKLVQIAQHVEDLDRASVFYEALLEQPPLARFDEEGLLFFDLDGVRLVLDKQAPTALIYLRVGNLHETIERLDGRVDVVTHPHVVFHHMDSDLGPDGFDEWQALIKDSEANTVGLVSFQRP